MNKRPFARITLQHVADEARFQYMRGQYYPDCQGASRCAIGPHWNLQFEYANVRARGGSRSLYYCDECLPRKYREVADSMLRGKEKTRVIAGATIEDLRTPPLVRRREPGSTIPWRNLL